MFFLIWFSLIIIIAVWQHCYPSGALSLFLSPPYFLADGAGGFGLFFTN